MCVPLKLTQIDVNKSYVELENYKDLKPGIYTLNTPKIFLSPICH